MRRRSVVFTLTALGMLTSCDTGVLDTPEKTVRTAFEAIQNEDWEAFQAVTITLADYILEANDISPMKAKDSFAGAILKPKQIKDLRKQFDRAVRGGDGQIDFRESRYRQLGTLVDTGTHDALTGGLVPFSLYSVVVKTGREDLDTQTLFPLFSVVKWRDQYRITALIF